MDEDWEEDETGWDHFEVRRSVVDGIDAVTLEFSRPSEIQSFNMTPEDALTIGVALAQAGQEIT